MGEWNVREQDQISLKVLHHNWHSNRIKRSYWFERWWCKSQRCGAGKTYCKADCYTSHDWIVQVPELASFIFIHLNSLFYTPSGCSIGSGTVQILSGHLTFCMFLRWAGKLVHVERVWAKSRQNTLKATTRETVMQYLWNRFRMKKDLHVQASAVLH